MKDVSFFTRIYISTEYVDFRKQSRGLAAIVDNFLELDSLSEKSLFVFTNRKRKSIKILYWDLTGYAMWVKNLEKDTFKWPKTSNSKVIHLKSKELKWLLDGVDLKKIKTHKKIII
jgi:transposase